MVESRQMVSKSLLSLLMLVCLLCLPELARADIPKPEDALQKLIQSTETVNFVGKRVIMSYTPNGAMVREELVTRKAPNKKRIEVLSPPAMSGVVILFSGKEPGRGIMLNRKDGPPMQDRKKMRKRPPFPPPPINEIDEFPEKNTQVLLRNYNILVLYGGHVARHNTYLLEIEPKLFGKPSRKVWIDTITSVPLKMEHYDSQRRLRWVFAYNEINFRPKIDDVVFQQQLPPPPERRREKREHDELWSYGKGKLDINKIRTTAQMKIMAPEQLPDGFDLQNVRLIRFDGRRSVHLTYSDGLTILSAFQSQSSDEKHKDEPPWEHDNVGNITVKGVGIEVILGGTMIIFRWNFENVETTLIGELSLSEMVKIAGSFIK